jgi:hypothetical protein
MPFCSDFDEPGQHVRVTGRGRVTMPETIAAIEEVERDSRFRPEFSLLLDIRAADYTADLQDGEVLAEVLRARRTAAPERIAIAVPESLVFLIKLYCLLANVAGFPAIRCFTDAAAAEEWCRGRGRSASA